MRRSKEQISTVVLPAAIAVAAFGLAAFVAYGMSTNAHQRFDGYYSAPSLIALQLTVGALAVTACLVTCRLAIRRAAGRTSSTVSAVLGAAISVALAFTWAFFLVIQVSS